MLRQIDLRIFLYVAREDYALFLIVARNVFARFVRKKIARKQPERFRFLGLCVHVGCPQNVAQKLVWGSGPLTGLGARDPAHLKKDTDGFAGPRYIWKYHFVFHAQRITQELQQTAPPTSNGSGQIGLICGQICLVFEQIGLICEQTSLACKQTFQIYAQISLIWKQISLTCK